MLKILTALWSALKPTLLSKKVQTAIFTTIANLALFFGWELGVEVAMALTSPLIAAIMGQTVVDVKKAGGVTASSALVLLVAAGLVSGAVVSSGCGGTFGSASRGAAASLVDCLAPNTKALAGELQGTVADVIRNATDNTGKVDWSSVRSSVRSYKSDAPLCAFQAAVTGMLLAARAPKDPDAPSAGLEVDPVSLTTGYESLRLELFAGRLGPLEQ